MRQQTEAYAKTRVNTRLRRLGWALDGREQNVYQEGDCRLPSQKQRLGSLRPDYILYPKGGDQPLAVIEVKRPGKNLDSAMRQGRQYAERLGADIVFATDSYVTIACRADGKPVRLGSVKIDDLAREAMLRRLSGGFDPDMRVIQSRDELVKIFKQAERELRRDGIDTGMDAVYEFCIILFIKVNSETKDDGQWRRLCGQTVATVMKTFRAITAEYKKMYRGIFREMKITKPETLMNIIRLLREVNLIDTDIDVKGEAYEHFLKRYSSWNKSVIGQFFTPRHITDMMAVYLDPAVGEKIYDPFCGTGGMLISCYRAMADYLASERDESILKENTLFGADINNGASQLAQMNMIVIGDGHTNIKCRDSLDAAVNREYQKVVTNIPFNLKGDFSDISRMREVDERNPNILCVLHCLRAAIVGGQALVIVPENICYQEAYEKGRRLLLREARLNAVIRLPRATFKSYTTARTCILHFTDIGKNRKTKSFPYVDIAHDGYSDSQWREPIERNDIPRFLENRGNLSEVYPLVALDAAARFTPADESEEFRANYCLLRELVEEKPIIRLDPDREYREPKLSSATNTISPRGGPRLGRNFKGGKKRLIEPGDLVVATLHTQRGRGLFAISDGYYVGESQLVARINTDIVDPDYLVAALRRILPTLKSDDLVGRETFKKEELLDLRVPRQPAWFSSAECKDTRARLRDMEKTLKEKTARAVDSAFIAARLEPDKGRAGE